MSGLNENHRRRILTSLQYADKLLQDNLHALSPGPRPLFAGYIQDLSPAKTRLIEGYTRKIREQMARLLTQCGVEAPAPSTYASWKLRTGITSLDLTLEDIYPEKMRGYGKMDAAAAHELVITLQEIRRLVNPLLSLLSQPEPGAAEGLNARPELAARVLRLTQVIAGYALIEFLPALNLVVRLAEMGGEGLDPAARRVEALRKALIHTLEKPAGRPLSKAVEQQLRHIDESIAALRHKWEPRFGDAAAWTKDILDAAAAHLTERHAERDVSSREIAAAFSEAVAARHIAFGNEYAQLAERIRAGIDEIAAREALVKILAHELPAPAPPPAHVPESAGIPVHGHPVRAGTAGKHVRSELRERLGAQFGGALQELQSRLQPWFAATMDALEESFRAQTDPVRYGSAPDPSVSEERRTSDLASLRDLL